MNWKNTWILVGLAAALFAFIMLFERHMTGSGYVERPRPLFADFKPAAATTIQLRRGNQPALTLERTNGLWHFTKPFSYPAANFTVQSFLEKLQRIVPATHISTRELSARKQTAADFGFDPAPMVLTLSDATSRRELHIGSRTTAGDQVYVQLIGTPGYFVVGADLLDGMLPRTPHEWRDTALFRFGDEKVDRAEIVQNGTSFMLALDPTNRLWRLAWPPHRADQLQVRQLLDRLVMARALEFVADGPQADLESFGLQMPEYELALSAGGITQRVQFGRSPTNDPSRVYARSMTYSNVVLVPRSYVMLLGAPYADLRDRQLVAFAPELVDKIEVEGEEKFTVRRTASNTWAAGDAPADPVFVAQWLALLSQLQVSEFVKDVVTDFAPYGLSPPQRSYSLSTIVTNAAGPTNILIARVYLGTNGSMDKAFARRWDEESLYGIRMLDFTHMPAAAWQLRDHRVWNFATNQVSKITVTQEGNVREVMRQPNGQWVGVKGFDGEINPFAMEELALQLGDLNALMWIARGESARAQYGFTTNTAQLSVELRGEKPQTLTVEFGALSPLLRPYALTMVNGQPYVFEFPWTILADLQRYFGLAPTGAGPRR